jgi:hypothetical protein
MEPCNRLRLDRGGGILRFSWPLVTPDLRLHLARYWDNIRINLVEIGRAK